MPEDVGGQPLPDGEEPDDRHHGEADEEFASVVFDEDFVRAAEVHEPTAVERILAAAQSHAETEPPRPYEEGYGYGPGGEGELDPGYDDDLEGGRFRRHPYPGTDGHGTTHGYGYGQGPYGAYGGFGTYGPHEDADIPDHLDDEHGRPYRGHARWQRPIAWVLAVVMGIGMVALAFAAVYRGASGQRQEPSPPPATSGVETPTEGRRLAPGSLPDRSPGAVAPTPTAEARQG